MAEIQPGLSDADTFEHCCDHTMRRDLGEGFGPRAPEKSPSSEPESES